MGSNKTFCVSSPVVDFLSKFKQSIAMLKNALDWIFLATRPFLTYQSELF